MFEGNRLVLILPLTLMVVMFIGGYYYINSSTSITNEQLQDEIEFTVETIEVEDGVRVRGTWDWKVMPSDGLEGDDYIGVAVIDPNTGEARSDVEFTEATVQLMYAGKTHKEITGNVVENGVIFTFPNKTIDHTSLGNIGQMKVNIEGNDITSQTVRVQMLHTWTDHASLIEDDATFAKPNFQGEDVPYWLISR